jgi:uncharacterized surface protein with fasciclin (FAS1) repeats
LIGTIRITDDVCIAEHPFGAAILSEIKITMTKKLFIIAGVVGALSLTAFASAPKKDIVDTAVGAGSFKTLVKLVQAAELVETLKGKGPFTVFAPSDTAFKKVPKATLDKLGKDQDLLRSVLTYHVVAGNVLAKDVVKLNGKSVETVNGESIKITVKNGKVFLNGNVQVVTTDIKTTNGTIHVLNGVLMPPAPKASAAKKDCGSCGN